MHSWICALCVFSAGDVNTFQGVTMHVASLEPQAPGNPASLNSSICFSTSSLVLVLGVSTYLSNKTVLPIRMNWWKNVRWTSSEMAVDSSQSSNVQPLPRYRNEPKIKSSSGMTVSQLHHNPSTKETSQLPLHLDKRCGMIHKAYGIGGKISFEISCNQRWDKKHTRGTK